MKNNNDNHDNKKSNVIDLTSRIQKEEGSGFLGLKVRWDLERTKVALSTSLLSVVLLVTLANNTALKSATDSGAMTVASESTEVVTPNRGLASVETGTSVLEDEMVRKLAAKELADGSIGRRPSTVENFAFGYLEGKYIVRHSAGKVREIEFNNPSSVEEMPKMIENRSRFLIENRELLPISFERVIRVGSLTADNKVTESYELLNDTSMPVAKVQFELDPAGRMLLMKFDRTALAR